MGASHRPTDAKQDAIMKTIQTTAFRKSLRFFTAFAISAALTAGFNVAASAAPDTHPKMEKDWAQHRQDMIKARLAKAAERLQIQAQQQGAWQAYADAVSSPIAGFHPDRNAPQDAASIAHRRADMAAGHAAKLAKVADATAALQAVLTPDQRVKFDKMVKFQHRHEHHGWHHGHDAPHHGGPRDGGVPPAAPAAGAQPPVPAYQ
jgi:hypothetical protein